MEDFKEKGKSMALVTDSEKTGIKSKSKETIESDSNEEEEERVCVIKKIKHKYVKEPTGPKKGKGVAKLQVMVVPKTPVAEPSCPTSKPVVLISSLPKSVLKVPVISKMPLVLKTPVAGPSTISASTVIATAPAPKPVPATSTVKPAEKGASVAKDPFILADTKESGVLIINQTTGVSAGKVIGAATQETLQSDKETGDENNEVGNGKNDGEGDNDDNDTMDVDASGLVADAKFLELLHLEEALQEVSMKTMVIEDIALVP
ncbi:hypothetical protein C0995_012246, partial [Termitomyces sp. Mi166